MAPLAVDPAALDGAGAAVGAVGDGLAAAVGALAAGYGANTGQDAAGEVFGLQYQDTAESVLTAVAAGVNACRGIGFKVQVSASNYSRAEAASTLGGGAGVLATPTAPGQFTAPGAPWTLGPGVPPPPLWALVQAFVGDVWPDGNPGQMHAAAGCWRTLGAALHGVKDVLAGPDAVIGAQQIPEGELMREALSTLGTDLAGIGAQCDKLAQGLDDFANDVQSTQDAIRDLLHRLGSASGLVHELVQVFTGHGLDELKKIAEDIKAVLGDLMRQAQARQQLLRQGMQVLDGLVRGLQIYVRAEITHYVGEDVGNPLATVFDTYTNVGEGVLKGAAGMGDSLKQLDPTRFAYDPKGAAASWEGLAKGVAETLALGDPTFAPLVDALDPQARTTLERGLVHADDWRAGRPGLGAGENLFDIAMLGIPGVGEAGGGLKGAEAAGAAGKAADAADAAGAAGRGGRALGGAGDLAGTTGALTDISKTTNALTKDLDNLGGTLPKTDPPAGGRPVGAPPLKPGEPAVGPPAHPVESTPAPRAEPPPPQHAPAPAAPDGAEPPTGPREPAPVPAGGPSPAPAGHLPSPGAQDAAPPHQPAPPENYPGQPALAGAHPPPPALPESTPGSLPGGAHPPQLPPHDPGRPGGGDGAGGGLSADGHDRTTAGDHAGADHGGPHSFDPPSGQHHDPVHNHAPSGDGWERLPDEPGHPHYGEPLPEHWQYPDNPADPGRIHPDVANLMRDPEAPFGRDPQGHPYTQQQYEERFNELGPEGRHWYHYASPDGAAPGTKVAFSDLEQFKKFYGEQVDRIGDDNGKYLAVMENGRPASWEQRALHVDSLSQPYHAYVVDHLPPGYKIVVSEIEPAVGQPGGALQLQILDDSEEALEVWELLLEGVLR